jgi:hypothetical protein
VFPGTNPAVGGERQHDPEESDYPGHDPTTEALGTGLNHDLVIGRSIL